MGDFFVSCKGNEFFPSQPSLEDYIFRNFALSRVFRNVAAENQEESVSAIATEPSFEVPKRNYS